MSAPSYPPQLLVGAEPSILWEGQDGCKESGTPNPPGGEKGEGWEGQYLEPGRDGLLLAALHWVLAGNDGVDVVVRGGPQCMAPESWHGSEGTARQASAHPSPRPLRSLWAAEPPQWRATLLGGEARAAHRPPPPPLGHFTSPNHCIRKGKK